MQRSRLAGACLAGVLCVLPLARAARAQQTDDETWARALVDHPAAAAGDIDGQCRELLELVAREPGHALADAALGIIQLRRPNLHDPTSFARALEAMSADGLTPAAARRLSVLQGNSRAGRMPPDALGADLHPGFLGHAFVLAPLGPLDHPLAYRTPRPEMDAPRFGEEHEGVSGPVRWLAMQRPTTARWLQPSERVAAGRGQALSAVLFDAPGGGPGFVEVEVRTSGGSPASYALALNGETPVVVDRLATPGSSLVAHPVALRDGRNSVMLQTPLDRRVQFALRVLGPDGLPRAVDEMTDLGEASRPLGPRGPAQAPRRVPGTSVSYLAGLAERGPDTEALLGVLLFFGDQEPEGLAHARRAHEQAPDRAGLGALLADLVGRADYLPTSWQRSHKRRLAEAVLELDPQRLDMALHVHEILANEDREEEAIAGLLLLGEALPAQPDSRLALADVYGRLGMDVAAEAALDEAQALAPDSPGVLSERARVLADHRQDRRAAETRLASLRAGGATGSGLRSVADRFLAVGEAERALDLMREAVLRDDDRAARMDLAGMLAGLDRHDEADALLAALAARFTDWERPCMDRADIALRRGDLEGELAALREALARRPSLRVARERLYALTGEDDTREYFARETAQVDAVMAAYDDAGQEESVVHVLDQAIVRFYEDGAAETLTQDVWRVRDLAGCEQLGRALGRLRDAEPEAGRLRGQRAAFVGRGPFQRNRAAGQLDLRQHRPGGGAEPLRGRRARDAGSAPREAPVRRKPRVRVVGRRRRASLRDAGPRARAARAAHASGALVPAVGRVRHGRRHRRDPGGPDGRPRGADACDAGSARGGRCGGGGRGRRHGARPRAARLRERPPRPAWLGVGDGRPARARGQRRLPVRGAALRRGRTARTGLVA
ncbi:MAG: hypothetical protein ACYTG2_16720 [Planctomycetota bacterium]